MKKKLLNFLGVMFIAQISFSQTITERFNYTDGASLTVAGSSSWSLIHPKYTSSSQTTETDPPSNTEDLKISSTTFASISDNNSKSVILNGSSSSYSFMYSLAPLLSPESYFNASNSNVLYVALAVNVSSASTSDSDYFAHVTGGLNSTENAILNRGRLYVKKDGEKFSFGVSWGTNTNAGNRLFTDASYDFNKSYILVIKYTSGTPDKGAKLFVFDNVLPATETSPVLSSTSTEGAINANGFMLRRASTNQNILVGGIIASTSWPTGMTITKATLPINLIDFKASEENGFVKLNWSTSSEKNNNHFEILKSTDGINFNSIGSINGSQNSSERKDYSLLDKSDIIGTTYYKLKQVDNNGESQEFDPIVFKKVKLDNDDFVVYIDASGKLNANFYAVAGELNISLYNLSGQKISDTKEVVKQSGKQNLLLNNPLIKGVYILKLNQGNKAVTKKVVL